MTGSVKITRNRRCQLQPVPLRGTPVDSVIAAQFLEFVFQLKHDPWSIPSAEGKWPAPTPLVGWLKRAIGAGLRPVLTVTFAPSLPGRQPSQGTVVQNKQAVTVNARPNTL